MSFFCGELVKLKDAAFGDKKEYITYSDDLCIHDGRFTNTKYINGQVAEAIGQDDECTRAYLPYLNRFINCFTYRFESLTKGNTDHV